MTTLLAIGAFALLFAVVAVLPLKRGGGGCGDGCLGCEGGECELEGGTPYEGFEASSGGPWGRENGKNDRHGPVPRGVERWT
jgi:hypothetical protein